MPKFLIALHRPHGYVPGSQDEAMHQDIDALNDESGGKQAKRQKARRYVNPVMIREIGADGRPQPAPLARPQPAPVPAFRAPFGAAPEASPARGVVPRYVHRQNRDIAAGF